MGNRMNITIYSLGYCSCYSVWRTYPYVEHLACLPIHLSQIQCPHN